MGGETTFADNEEYFILDILRQGYAAQLQACLLYTSDAADD